MALRTPEGPVQATPPAVARRTFRADVTLMLMNRVGVMLITVVSSALTARVLGPAGRGALSVSLAFALILAQVGDAGLTSANPYFGAREPSAVAQLIVNALWLVLAISALVIAAGFAIAATFPSVVRGVSGSELALAFGVVPATLTMTWLQGLLLGEGRTLAFNTIELASNVGYVALLGVGLLALHVGIRGVLVLTVCRSTVGAAWCFVVLARAHRPLPLLPDGALVRRVLAYGARVYIANLMAFLVIRADLLLVNAYRGTDQAGLYSVTVAVADALYVIPTAFAVNLFPRVARGGTTAQSADVFRKVAILFAGLCLLAALLAQPAITLVYGSHFEAAVALFYWLVPGTFCLGMLNVLAHHFAGRGFPIQVVLMWLASLVVNVSVNVLFLSDGTYVAALSSTLAYLMLLILHVRMFRNESGSIMTLVPRRADCADLMRVLGRLRLPSFG